MNDDRIRTKEERRGDILDAATALFGERGYRNSTTDEIAEAARVTKRTLYRHTGSKERILLLIHERFLDEVESVRLGDSSSTAEASFRRFVRAYVNVVVANQSAIRVFFEELKNLSADNRRSVVKRRDRFEAWVRDLIADGIASGEFVENDVRLTTAAILGALANIYRWYSPSGEASPDDVAAIAADLFLAGLVRRPRVRTSSNSLASTALRPSAESGGPDDLAPARPLPESILQAGIDLFVEHGYRATSTRQIAERAGITKSALFYYIGSKEELLFAITDRFARESLTLITDRLSAVSRPNQTVGALEQFILTHCKIMHSERKVVEIFTDQLRYLHGDYLAAVTRKREAYTKAVERVIAFGVEGGSLRTDNPKIATLLIIGMLNSMYRWYRPGGRLSASQIGERFASLILHGLKSRE